MVGGVKAPDCRRTQRLHCCQRLPLCRFLQQRQRIEAVHPTKFELLLLVAACWVGSLYQGFPSAIWSLLPSLGAAVLKMTARQSSDRLNVIWLLSRQVDNGYSWRQPPSLSHSMDDRVHPVA